MLVGLAVGTAAYALSLLRSPAEDLLSAHASAVMATGMQRRLARAVCAPAGVEHLEDPAVLDQLASASGELSTSGPADAPMALASAFGDRLSGFIACVVLASFRWYIGLIFFAGWSLLRPPLRRLLAERALLVRRATPELRHSWYYLGCSYRPAFAKEVRVFGLGRWILDRHRDKWLAGMEAPWQQMHRFRNRAVLFGLGVAAMYVAGAGVLALAAWHRDIGLGTVAVMLPMLPSTMQVGGVTAADVTLEQMLAAVPDLDNLVGRLRTGTAASGEAGADGPITGPVRSIRFESVAYRYPGGGGPVYQGLDLDLTAGHSLALVGANGAGKTTLVTLLARLREPTAGRITVDGTDLRDLDARSWQRQVAVVQPGLRPLSADRQGERRLPGPDRRRPATSTKRRWSAPRPGPGRLTSCAPCRTAGTPSAHLATGAVLTCPAASGSGWRWPARSTRPRGAPGCSCSTSRRPSSTSGPRRPSTTGFSSSRRA